MPACHPIPPVYAAVPLAPAASLEPSALLLAGGGVAALGIVCVVGLIVLIGLAAALEGDSPGGVASSRGGAFEDNASSFMAQQGGSYTAPSVNYGD